MNNKNLVLLVGVGLILFGLLKPNLDLSVVKPADSAVSVEVTKPTDPTLLKLSEELVSVIKNSNVSKIDASRLSTVCFDIGTLVSLDSSNEVIKNTEEIRQANKLVGLMLRMDMNKKYPGLAEAMNKVVVSSIGDDIVPLNNELRNKATQTFQALAWSYKEGVK